MSAEGIPATKGEGESRQQAVAMDIQRRLVDHIRNRSTDREAAPVTNDPGVYTSRHWHELEQQKVFQALPLLVGMSCDIPNSGDKILFDAAGPQIVILRAGDGGVRAYLNMCTHRAAQLVTKCTPSKRMTCGFHGWTFDLEGNLIGQPSGASFEGLDKSRFRLISVPVQEWRGLIFVIARPGTADDIDVENFLGAFAPELAQMNFEDAVPVKSNRIDVAANWKYAYDTYGEGYHFSTLHPTTIAMTAHSDMVAHDVFGLHQRINFPYKNLDQCVDMNEADWPRRPYGGVHLLFPNSVINVSSMGPGQVFSIYRLFPDGGPDKAFSLMAAYRSGNVPPETDMKPWEEFHDFITRVVETEDYSISATGQRNLRYAPSHFRLTFGRNEGVLHRFHRQIAEIIGRNQ